MAKDETDGTDLSDKDLVRQTLRAIMEDTSATAAARSSASRTLAEINGMVGKHADPDDPANARPVTDMSRAEIEAELALIAADRSTQST